MYQHEDLLGSFSSGNWIGTWIRIWPHENYGKTPAQFLMLLCSLCAQNEKTTPTHIKCSFRFVTGKRPRRKLLPTDGRRKRVKKEKKNAMVRQWVWKEQKWDKMVHHLPAIPIVPASVRTCQHHHITTEYQAAILSTKQNTVSWIQLYFKINDDRHSPKASYKSLTRPPPSPPRYDHPSVPTFSRKLLIFNGCNLVRTVFCHPDTLKPSPRRIQTNPFLFHAISNAASKKRPWPSAVDSTNWWKSLEPWCKACSASSNAAATVR